MSGLAPGLQVTLTLRDHGILSAIVDAVDGDDLVLVPVVAERWPADLETLPASLEHPGRTGLIRATGHARRGPRGTIRFTAEGAPERIQRREWARAEVARPVEVRRTTGGAPVETWTLDVSAGGARLSGPHGLRAGERVEVRIRLDEVGDVVVVAIAEVARATAEGNVALRLADIGEADRERIVRFVLEQQRLELRRTRRP